MFRRCVGSTEMNFYPGFCINVGSRSNFSSIYAMLDPFHHFPSLVNILALVPNCYIMFSWIVPSFNIPKSTTSLLNPTLSSRSIKTSEKHKFGNGRIRTDDLRVTTPILSQAPCQLLHRGYLTAYTLV